MNMGLLYMRERKRQDVKLTLYAFLPPANLPQMCSSTTKAMNSKLSTRTVVGPLRNASRGHSERVWPLREPQLSLYKPLTLATLRLWPRSRQAPSPLTGHAHRAGGGACCYGGAHIFRPGASSV